jgi:hypothetical protein
VSDKEITRRSRDAEDEEEEEEREMMKTRKTRKTEKVCCRSDSILQYIIVNFIIINLLSSSINV